MKDSRSVFEVDFQDFLESLPAPQRLTPAAIDLIGGPDPTHRCLIVVQGFERRCLGAMSMLAAQQWKAKSVIWVRYGQADMSIANDAHLQLFKESVEQIADVIHEVNYYDPEVADDFGNQITAAMRLDALDPLSPATKVVFDISVGSSRLLLEGLHALMTSGVDLTLLYSEASEYRPSFSEHLRYVEDRRELGIPAPEFLAIGVDRVEILRRIPGRGADARPTYLVAVPSFTPLRIDAVLTELAPSRVHWIFGIPHLTRNRWRLDAQRDYHQFLAQPLHRHCYASTFDYREILSVLEAIYRRRRQDYNILVCSLGSKMQKVGQVLFHVLRPEVGAITSVPRRWEPERYSSDIPRAVYGLGLGDVATLRHRLWQTRTLKL